MWTFTIRGQKEKYRHIKFTFRAPFNKRTVALFSAINQAYGEFMY